jgi:6-oxo-cyclohex-1-ene-carbonyl-CoA hydrolase
MEMIPMLKSHTLVPEVDCENIRYELRPALDPSGDMVEGLFNAWIILDNPSQYNSYTTETVKEVILAFRQASMDRSVVCCVFTAVGDKAFCTGGNTKEYAE